MHNKLIGGYRPGTRTYAHPSHQHALHLRWLNDELITQIKRAAKQHNRSTVDFVVGVLKRYLAGNSSAGEPLGLCPVCKRRAGSSLSPLAASGKNEKNMKPSLIATQNQSLRSWLTGKPET